MQSIPNIHTYMPLPSVTFLCHNALATYRVGALLIAVLSCFQALEPILSVQIRLHRAQPVMATAALFWHCILQVFVGLQTPPEE